MKHDLRFPDIFLATPERSRTRKLVPTVRITELEVPSYGPGEISRILKYKHVANQFGTEIFRIGSQHYRKAEVQFPGDKKPSFGSMNDVGEFMLCKAAWKWVEKSIPIDTPLTNGLPYFSGDALFRILGSLPETGTLKLSNIDEELRDSYLKHMGEFAAGLISLDGYAYTPCSEPVYVVTGYGSVTVVEVQTEETLPEGSIAVFPLGACGEAVQFAAAISEQNGLRYGQILSDIYDSGDPIRTDYDARSLRQAAIVTARRFETLHTPYSPSQDDVRHLLNELPIEDIILYRSLKNIVKIIDLNDEISNRTFSLLEQALQSSTSSQLFTDRGLFPLKSVLDLWENRPVSIPGNVSVPKFR